MTPPDIAGTAADPWVTTDVFLLTDGSEGRVAVPELVLSIGTEGIDLAKADGHLVWRCQWDEVSEFMTPERSLLADGRDALVVEVGERTGRAHRFVLPSADPAEDEQRVRDIARAHGMVAPESHRALSVLLTTVIVLAVLGTLAVLMLSADHVIRL
jgi:hypothetical protein